MVDQKTLFSYTLYGVFYFLFEALLYEILSFYRDVQIKALGDALHTSTRGIDILSLQREIEPYMSHHFWLLYGSLSVVFLLLGLRYLRGEYFKRIIKIQNRELQLINRRLKKIIDTQKSMILITDGSEVVEVNAKVLEFFGFTSLQQMQQKVSCICHFFLPYKDYFHLGLVSKKEDWIRVLAAMPAKKRVVNMVGKEMQARAFSVDIYPYGEENRYIVSFVDVTDLLLEQKVLEYKAEHDQLTGIYNRQKIDETLLQLCRFNHRRKERVGIIMFDIDHFKKVNDQYGHDVGDEVLKMVAKVVKKAIRSEDIFGRWGGEEFLLILRHSSVEDTYKKAQKLRALIASYRAKSLPAISASFGVTGLSKEDTTKTLLKRVDLALYEAKSRGRNCVVEYLCEVSAQS